IAVRASRSHHHHRLRRPGRVETEIDEAQVHIGAAIAFDKRRLPGRIPECPQRGAIAAVIEAVERPIFDVGSVRKRSGDRIDRVDFVTARLAYLRYDLVFRAGLCQGDWLSGYFKKIHRGRAPEAEHAGIESL